jgi:hypothetical protein
LLGTLKASALNSGIFYSGVVMLGNNPDLTGLGKGELLAVRA